MQKSAQEQMQKIFQSLFSKEQLRKNLYLYQHLGADMSLKTKVIYQERRVAAVSKDPAFILQCLHSCPQVKVLGPDSICILASGDALIVRISSQGDKGMSTNEIKKMASSLLKDIKNQIRDGNKDGEIEIQFQSETSVAQFIQRLKSKGAPVKWELKQKDPFQCIKKSIRFLLKQRKNQQQSNYTQQQAFYGQNYYQGYDQNQYGYQSMRPGYSYGNFQNNYQQAYPIFIRKAVDSDQEDNIPIEPEIKNKQKIMQKEPSKLQKVQEKTKQQKKKESVGKTSSNNGKKIKFDADDFPQL